jgi:DNA-3-methyladenine glycosylase I
MRKVTLGPDGMHRCGWSNSATEFFDYHDDEWGYPVSDDRHLFEKLCLESFQSGLSWRTILNKRDNFRIAFANFEIDRVAEFRDDDIQRLLHDTGIVRHRGKIEAVINNAKLAQEMIRSEGSFAAYVWRFEPTPENCPEPQTVSTSPESVTMSKDLKKRGWKFVGPTTVFAFMQAMGLINDHAHGCSFRNKVAEQRHQFVPPN